MARVQTTISGKAEKLWELVSHSKRKTIEQALISLAQDKKLADIFFDDMEAVEAVLKGDEIFSPKKPKATPTPVKSQNKPQVQKQKKDGNDQVETAW